MSHVTKILSDEHKLILEAIDILTIKTNLLTDVQELDRQFYDDAISFIRDFADRFHHAKEEDILFVELNSDEVSMHCNPTGQMLYEHELGRSFVRAIEQGLRDGDIKMIKSNVSQYAELLTDHIFKEDMILYPMADQALGMAVQEAMIIKFKKVSDGHQYIIDKSMTFLEKYRQGGAIKS